MNWSERSNERNHTKENHNSQSSCKTRPALFPCLTWRPLFSLPQTPSPSLHLAPLLLQFPVEFSLPWILTSTAMKERGLHEHILIPLELYNDAASHALYKLKSQVYSSTEDGADLSCLCVCVVECMCVCCSRVDPLAAALLPAWLPLVLPRYLLFSRFRPDSLPPIFPSSRSRRCTTRLRLR